MTSLDIIILLVAAGSLAYGWWRGIIVQAGALGAVLFAVLLCRLAGAPLAQLIAHGGVPDMMDRTLAYVLVFIIGYVSVRLLCRLIKSVAHSLNLGFFDRVIGAVFSLFQWMLVLSLALNFWLVLSPDTSYARLSHLAGGRVALFIVELGPAVLGWATGC
ncbi:MAG TPA: hypothetical protein DCR26_05055 [Porphyromonadaceae bacterium]|jgi:membrane protein required for colicin V production|nr:CvpA family protein [Muribaculaceae bacterium Isolate-013 (NCI)]HAP29472.1 hypothetical protein [Porphyromonadaceae bacterium]